MATQSGRFNNISLLADEALAQFRLVTLDPAVSTTDGYAAYPAAQGNEAFGVTLGSASGSGKAVAVQYDGIAQVEASAAISAGDYVTVGDTAGRVGPATAGDLQCGVALNAAADANEIISVLLKPSPAAHAA